MNDRRIVPELTGNTENDLIMLQDKVMILTRLVNSLLDGGIKYENVSLPGITDKGIDSRKIRFFPNRFANTGFERYNVSTNVPLGWTTDGVTSADASFEGNRSLKLTNGQYAYNDTTYYVTRPVFWNYKPTRVTFQKKLGAVKVRMLDATNSNTPITLTNESGVIVGTEITFPYNSNWDDDSSRCTFTFNPPTNCTSLIIRFDGVDPDYATYIDNVDIHPDKTGFPQLYIAGAKSTSTGENGSGYSEGVVVFCLDDGTGLPDVDDPQEYVLYVIIDADELVFADTIAEWTSGNGVTVDGVLLKDSQVTTDVINEKTADTGVTVDSVLLKDGLARSTTAQYRRYYHIPLYSFNPGASGATHTPPDANTVGGWQLNAAGEVLYCESDIHSDWDGVSDLKVELKFEVNVDNTGGADTDTVDLRLQCFYKGAGDTACKTQTVEVATVVGKSARYKQFKVEFTIDYDAVSNVVESGDTIDFILNLETDTSEVDDIIINDGSFYYNTKNIGIESTAV